MYAYSYDFIYHHNCGLKFSMLLLLLLLLCDFTPFPLCLLVDAFAADRDCLAVELLG